MKSSKIRILSTSVVLLFSAGLLSGCGGAPKEDVTQSDEVITEEPIQSLETIIELEPQPITSFEGEDNVESHGDIDWEEAESNSMEGVRGELSDAASETIDAAKETATEAADTLVDIIDMDISETDNTGAGLQEGVSSEVDMSIVESVADVFEDGEEIVAATPDLIRRVQQALVNAGYKPGPVDGISGPRTLAAIKDFQQDNNLAAGELTKETLRTLGVNF